MTKNLPGTNTLAHYENPQFTAVKTFIEMAPGFEPGTMLVVLLVPNHPATAGPQTF